MHKRITNRVSFVAKSLAWATILFSATMFFTNWSEVKSGVTGRYVIIASTTDTVMCKIAVPQLEPVQSVLLKSRTLLSTIHAGISSLMSSDL